MQVHAAAGHHHRAGGGFVFALIEQAVDQGEGFIPLGGHQLGGDLAAHLVFSGIHLGDEIPAVHVGSGGGDQLAVAEQLDHHAGHAGLADILQAVAIFIQPGPVADAAHGAHADVHAGHVVAHDHPESLGIGRAVGLAQHVAFPVRGVLGPGEQIARGQDGVQGITAGQQMAEGVGPVFIGFHRVHDLGFFIEQGNGQAGHAVGGAVQAPHGAGNRGVAHDGQRDVAILEQGQGQGPAVFALACAAHLYQLFAFVRFDHQLVIAGDQAVKEERAVFAALGAGHFLAVHEQGQFAPFRAVFVLFHFAGQVIVVEHLAGQGHGQGSQDIGVFPGVAHLEGDFGGGLVGTLRRDGGVFQLAEHQVFRQGDLQGVGVGL